MATSKLTVEIREDLHRRLKRVALERGDSMRAIVEGLLGAWLPKQEAELEQLRDRGDRDRGGK